MVTDERVEVGDDPDRVVNVAFTHFFICGNAVNAFFQQVVAGVSQDVDRFEHRLANHRLHYVQLQLTGLGGHRHGSVVTDDFEANLVHHFWHDRVHLSWHDGRTRLQFWQVDFVQASARAGREQAQVVTDFGQFHRQTFQCAVYHHVRAAVGGGFNQVFRRHDRQVGHFSQLLNRQLLIAIRGVQTRTDGGCAQVHFQQQLRGAQQVFGLFIQQHVKCVEFLAQRHWHCVL